MTKPYTAETENGDRNLIWAIKNYFDEYCLYRKLDATKKAELREYTEGHIYTQINPDIKIEGYVDTNIINLSILFRKLRSGILISNKEFMHVIRPLITESIETYYKDIYGIDDVFWGAWYKAEDTGDPYGAIFRRSFTESEKAKLVSLLLDPDASGEVIGYALCVYTGCTVEDAMNARFGDIFELKEHTGTYSLHIRGSFPKRTAATEYDTYPRFVPLTDEFTDVLMKRRETVESRLSFPAKTDVCAFKDINEIPVACRGDDYTSFTSVGALSRCATEILKNELAFREIRMAYNNKDMMYDAALFAAERSGAYYMGRRSYGTTLYGSGLDKPSISYFMGLPRDASDDTEAFEVSDQLIFEAKKKIESM